VIAKPTLEFLNWVTRFTLDPLCEGGIQTRMSIAKEEIKSRGKELKKED
jgi:hypothetical protein